MKKHQGYSLIVVLILFSIGAFVLNRMFLIYEDSSYQREASQFGQQIIEVDRKIQDALVGYDDCSAVSTNFVVNRGLIPSDWEVDTSVDPYRILYKYGDIQIASNVRSGLLPPDGYGPYDAYFIKFRFYRVDRGVRLVEQLIEHFDSIAWGGRLVKAYGGVNQAEYKDAIDNPVERTGINFVRWGC